MNLCRWLLLPMLAAAAFGVEHHRPNTSLTPVTSSIQSPATSNVFGSGGPGPAASNTTDAGANSAMSTGMTTPVFSTTSTLSDGPTSSGDSPHPSDTTSADSTIVLTSQLEQTSDASSLSTSPPPSSPTSMPFYKPPNTKATPMLVLTKSTVPPTSLASPLSHTLTKSLSKPLPSSSPSSSARADNISTHRKSTTIGIVFAVLVVVAGSVAGWVLYKRSRRRRDRRAWERTHREIADAVRQVNTPAPGATGTLLPSRGTSRASSACAQSDGPCDGGEDVDPFVDEQYDMFDAVASPPSMTSVRSQSPLCAQHHRPVSLVDSSAVYNSVSV